MAILQKLVFPMRETMPFFVSSLRAVDDWKRIHAKRADAITQAEFEANAKYVKSPFARSMNVDDLLRFLDDTVLDINFMVQLPSIERCLDKWWNLYARDKHAIGQDTLRTVYYDLAFVLVEAKTETIHKNSVSMILRASWTKWSPKEPPLGKSEFYRLLFILAHLMTTTDRLGEYIIFFHDTMSRIARKYYQKQMRVEQHSRQPRTRRKSTLNEIFSNGKASPPKIMSGRLADALSESSPVHRVNVQVGRIPVEIEARFIDDDDEGGDCFVELLDRTSRYQRVEVDPLLHDRKFQEKFKLPGGGMNGNSTSTNDMMVALNPLTNKFCPPLLARRLQPRTSQGPTQPNAFGRPINAASSKRKTQITVNDLSKPGFQNSGHQQETTNVCIANVQTLHASKSAPAICFDTEDRTREEDLLRRSLSRVPLKPRVSRNKAAGAEMLKNRGHELVQHSPTKDTAKQGIYLAIST